MPDVPFRGFMIFMSRHFGVGQFISAPAVVEICQRAEIHRNPFKAIGKNIVPSPILIKHYAEASWCISSWYPRRATSCHITGSVQPVFFIGISEFMGCGNPMYKYIGGWNPMRYPQMTMVNLCQSKTKWISLISLFSLVFFPFSHGFSWVVPWFSHGFPEFSRVFQWFSRVFSILFHPSHGRVPFFTGPRRRFFVSRSMSWTLEPETSSWSSGCFRYLCWLMLVRGL